MGMRERGVFSSFYLVIDRVMPFLSGVSWVFIDLPPRPTNGSSRYIHSFIPYFTACDPRQLILHDCENTRGSKGESFLLSAKL